MDVNELFSPSPVKDKVQEDFLEPAVRARVDQLIQNVRLQNNFDNLEEIYMAVEFQDQGNFSTFWSEILNKVYLEVFMMPVLKQDIIF